MQGIIFRTLSGTPGWSYKCLQTIDIAKVGKMSYWKRLFMICNRDRPYTLEIEYIDISNEISIAPTIVGPRVGFTFTERTTFSHNMTYRYETEKDIINAMDDIKSRQLVLKRMVLQQREIAEKLRLDMENEVSQKFSTPTPTIILPLPLLLHNIIFGLICTIIPPIIENYINL